MRFGKMVTSVLILSFSLFYFGAIKIETDKSEQFKYIGADKCGSVCHKGDSKGNQYEKWQNSKHSKAFLTLQTPEADKIALDKGFTTSAAETPACVKCHVLGKDLDESEFTETFDKTQGVQCETCHGPGSEYKGILVMKDKELSKEKGLIIHKNDRDVFCATCHNQESPTFKGFNLDEEWEKIKHLRPVTGQ